MPGGEREFPMMDRRMLGKWSWWFLSALGAVIGYGFLLGFLWLVVAQISDWLRVGEWIHLGVAEGLHAELVRCCVHTGDKGHWAVLLQWLESPINWLGLHKLLEVLPASLAMFMVSVTGNCLFIYCKDRIAERKL